MGLQPIQKFPTFYGTRRFSNTFTSARHLPLSWARIIQSRPSHPTSPYNPRSCKRSPPLRPHLQNPVSVMFMLCCVVLCYVMFMLCYAMLCLCCVMFMLCCVMLFPLYHTCYIPRSSHYSSFGHLNNIWWAVQIINILINLSAQELFFF